MDFDDFMGEVLGWVDHQLENPSHEEVEKIITDNYREIELGYAEGDSPEMVADYIIETL